MAQPVQSDGVGVLFSRESTPGTQPTTGWSRVQVNPGGIQAMTRQNVVVERHILSPNMTPERGEVVGYDVTPKLLLDLTKDVLDNWRELVFRSATKQSGGTGTCKFFPTAVSATALTVPAGGALAQNVLLNLKNFVVLGNNGLHVVGVGSTATSIVAAGLAIETPPSIAVAEVAGVQGTAGDIGLDANGNLTSTTLDFTTLGLNPGQMINVGDPTSGSAFAFANTAYTGIAIIVSVAAHLVTLKRRAWTVGAADNGAGKTIRLLFHSFITNVPLDPTGANGYLPAPTGSLEISELGSNGGTDYTYANGLAVDTLDLDIPVESKASVTLGLVGMVVSNPTASRSSGPSTAVEAVHTGVFTTAANMPDIRLLKQADESRVSLELNSLKLSYKNNVKPRKQLGTAGAAGLIFGEYTPMLSADAYVLDNNLTNAINANTDCTLDFVMKTGAGSGFGMDFPMVKIRKGDKTYAAGDSVKIACDVPANRDPASGTLWSMSQFSYLP